MNIRPASRYLNGWTLSILVPPLCWLLAVGWFDVNFPIMDEIDIPGFLILKDASGGKVAWSDFFYWHNESKKAIPNLILFSLYKLAGQWNLKLEMTVSILLGAANSLLIVSLAHRLLRGATGVSMPSAGAFGLIHSLYYFAPYAFFRWINGITLHRVLPDTFLLLSLLVFLKKAPSPWLKVGAYTLLSIGSQFSFSGGIVLWPITLMLTVFENRDRGVALLQRIGGLLTACALTQWLYFYDANPLVTTTASKAGDVFGYDLYRMSVYVLSFISTGIYRHGDDRLAALIGLACLLFILLAWIRLRDRTDIQSAVTISGLLLYPVLLAVLAGIGRDFGNPRQVRYVLYGAYLPVAVALTTQILISLLGVRRLKYALLLPLTILYIESYLDGNAFRQAREHVDKLSAARSCLLSTDDDDLRRPCLRTIYPPLPEPEFEEANRRLKALVANGALR